MVKLAHARWRVELDYREMKDELGLDHFDGRHWLGFHHHVTLVSRAYAFLHCEQMRSKKAATLTLPTARRELRAALIRITGRCPGCLTKVP